MINIINMEVIVWIIMMLLLPVVELLVYPVR